MSNLKLNDYNLLQNLNIILSRDALSSKTEATLVGVASPLAN